MAHIPEVFVGQLRLSFWLVFRDLSSQALYQDLSAAADDSGRSGKFSRFRWGFGVSGA